MTELEINLFEDELEINLFEDLLLVDEEPITQTTAGGLHLPGKATENPTSPLRAGKVCAAGPGRRIVTSEGRFCVTALKAEMSDRVLYHMHSAKTLIVNGKPFKLVADHDVLARIGKDVIISQIHA